MSPDDRAELERELRALHAAGDLARVIDLGLRAYGAEIFGFLRAFHRSEEDAAEVFAIFAERIWRGLPDFAWACSFRTWAYTIARNAGKNHKQAARRRARVQAPLPSGSALSELVGRAQRESLTGFTELERGITKIRASLPEADRELLSLRLDRELAWIDLVHVLHEGSESELTPEAVARESAKLRKRFQSIKTKLAGLARAEGLIGRQR